MDPFDIVGLLNGLKSAVDELSQKLADSQAAAESIAKENYDKGFADGVASVVVPPPADPELKFTQADMDAAVAAAVGPLNATIAELQAKVDGIPAAIKAAVADKLNQLVLDEKQIEEVVAVLKSHLTVEEMPMPTPVPTPEPVPVPPAPPAEEEPLVLS